MPNYFDPCINVQVTAQMNLDGCMHNARTMHIYRTEVVTTVSPSRKAGWTKICQTYGEEYILYPEFKD